MKTKLLILLLFASVFLYAAYLSPFGSLIFKKNNRSDIYHCRDCNVVLISMTNLRYDHASFDGYTRKTTPNLDKLAKDSLVFDNAFSHASWTLPDSISMYTGLYPYQHGVMQRHDGSTLSKNTPTLMDFFNKNGYLTAAFTGGFDYNPAFGATSRFKVYQECAYGQEKTYPRQSGPREKVGGTDLYGQLKCTVPKAIDWLKQNSKNKFFLHVQGFDAHCPFSQGNSIFDSNYQGKINFSNCIWTEDKITPQMINGQAYYSVYSADKKILLNSNDVKHLIALYDESIWESDRLIGQLLKEVDNLGLSGKTVIVFTSEHGDMLGKNGRFMRGGPTRGTLYDDVLHIPLIIKLPGIAAGRVAGLVAHIDLMPTILDLVGIQNTARVEGKSLRPLIFGNTNVNDYIFAGSIFTEYLENSPVPRDSSAEVVRSLDWKLIRETVWEDGKSKNQTVSKELYNLKVDKQELKNVSATDKTILNIMEGKLTDWENRVKPKI